MNFKRLLLSAAAMAFSASLAVPAQAVTLYSVRPHETISRIAQDHHVSVNSIRRVNPDLNKNGALKTGQVIMLPDADEVVSGTGSNVVIHSYRIVNPVRKVIAEVKSPAVTTKAVVLKSDVPKMAIAKHDTSVTAVDAGTTVKTIEPAASGTEVAVASAADMPQADTKVILEQTDVPPASSPDLPVTHVPNQDNIAIIDSQIIHVPVYVAPVDSSVPPAAGSATTGYTLAHHPTELASRHGSIVASVISMAHHFMGIHYVWGGTTPSGFDCSGFTQRVFALSGITIPRLADAQYYQGTPVKDPSPGDLVFFSTYLPGPSHVGIYLGGNQFIHASSRKGVTVSSLTDAYYAKAYIGARRYY